MTRNVQEARYSIHGCVRFHGPVLTDVMITAAEYLLNKDCPSVDNIVFSSHVVPENVPHTGGTLEHWIEIYLEED